MAAVDPADLDRPRREVYLPWHPYSVIGTPARTGPYSRLRTTLDPKRNREAYDAWVLIDVHHVSVRDTAARLGLSPTTAWRRARWWWDWHMGPIMYGTPQGPPPHQRGTRACPRGRPTILPHDSESVLRQLLAAGYTYRDVIGSHRTVPEPVRNLALYRLVWARADEDTVAWLAEMEDRAIERRRAKREKGIEAA